MPRHPAQDTCFFDGRCGFCRASVRRFARLDWLGRLRILDMHAVPPGDLPIPLETAMTGMPMLTRTGRILIGFPAVRRALLQLPLTALPALLLYLPGLSHLAAAIYRHIARTRLRDAVCTPSTA